MHEFSIAEEILSIVRQKLKENGMTRAKRVTLIIGELTSIVPDALETALCSLAPGTPIEGTKFVPILKKLKARCGSCGKTFRVKDFDYSCPSCGKTPATVIEGRELIVKTIEAE